LAEAMDYDVYKALRREGRIRAGIVDLTAMNLLGYLPKKYQITYHILSWVWFLSFPAFFLVSIFVKWWLGLVLLILMAPKLYSFTRKSASRLVLRYAEENKEFFEMLVSKNILEFKT